jgi:predicted aspartyl protease
LLLPPGVRSIRRCLVLLLALSLFAGSLFASAPIPFEYRDGMIWVKVSVAGRKERLNFLLDSGAGASVIDIVAARKVGLKLGDRQTVLGAGGRSVAFRVDGFRAQAADVAVACSLLALDLSAPSAGCHQRIDGLLGGDFLRDHIVEINFAAQTLRLLRRDEVNTGGYDALHLTRRNDTLCAQISVDGNAPEWLRLDTGCNTSLEWVVSGDRARNLGNASAASNASSVREIETNVLMGGVRIDAVKTGVHREQMFADESGLIGNGLLSKFTIIIDAAGQRCLLAKRRVSRAEG